MLKPQFNNWHWVHIWCFPDTSTASTRHPRPRCPVWVWRPGSDMRIMARQKPCSRYAVHYMHVRRQDENAGQRWTGAKVGGNSTRRAADARAMGTSLDGALMADSWCPTSGRYTIKCSMEYMPIQSHYTGGCIHSTTPEIIWNLHNVFTPPLMQ